ncbi:hypothetical protein MKW92_028397, partial [Papaver armeniacum]
PMLFVSGIGPGSPGGRSPIPGDTTGVTRPVPTCTYEEFKELDKHIYTRRLSNWSIKLHMRGDFLGSDPKEKKRALFSPSCWCKCRCKFFPPKLIVAGASAYIPFCDYARIRQVSTSELNWP